MREIKFRAWNGKYMVDASYGDWVSFDGVPYTEAGQKYNTPHTEIQKAKDYTLMQFTGLKDKNGKEIYEGDVVRRIAQGWNDDATEIVRSEEISVIEYSGHGFWVKDESFGWEGEDLWSWDDMEVVGNIHENPELI